MGDNDTIPALSRAIELLTAVASGARNESIAEIGRRLDIPTTTCYRIIRTLMDHDWLRQRGKGVGYELSYGLWPLLEPFENQRVLINAVEAHIAELVDATHLSAKVSIVSGDAAMPIHRTNSKSPIALTGRIGVRFHLAFGSSGAALMSGHSTEAVAHILDSAPAAAWLHQSHADVHARIEHCRRHGWCADLGGYRPQIHTISAPITGLNDQVVAAITLLAMPGDLDGRAMKTIARNIVETADLCNRHISKEASD